MNYGGFRGVNNYHAAGSRALSGQRRDSSRDSADPLTGSSTAVRSQTPVPLPKIPVMLGTLAFGRRGDYQETAVVHDEVSTGPRVAAATAAGSSAVRSDLPSQLKERTEVKETPVPLPPWMPQRQTVQVNPQPPAPQGTASTAPQTPGTSKRGRPKGWKPGMSYAEVRGDTPSEARAVKKIRATAAATAAATRDGIVKRRGRPPKQPSPPPVELYHRHNAPFIAFLCEWAGCKAELHNLDTLRRHIRTVHLRPLQGPRRRCRWGKCKPTTVEEEMDEEGKKGQGGEAFAGKEDLEAHIEGRHLIPFSWHIGDGPRNSGGQRGKRIKKRKDDGARDDDGDNDDNVPHYLKDANGNQVTPSIEGQAVEDYATWRINRKKLKQLLLERDRNLPSEDDESPAGEGEVEVEEEEVGVPL